tara:strand:+ start:15746 stop:18565 length:2820 start_codon:yes stop_codon:yes gene_type:complete
VIELHYTGYQRPILESLLDHLWGADFRKFPDLSDTAILLPTRNVGRKIREALALRAAKDGRALLSPTVLTPGSLFSSLGEQSSLLSRADQTLFVAQTISRLPRSVLTLAFGEITDTSFDSILSLSQFFLETRRLLAESLLDFQLASENPDLGDRDRWSAYAVIEKAYRRLAHENGRVDPDDQAAEWARTPSGEFPWRRIVVAGAPDFPERVATFLRHFGEIKTVEILVLADRAAADGFDDVGRPIATWFLNAPIPISDQSLHLCKEVGEANREIADQIQSHPESQSASICGAGTPVDGAALAFELVSRGLPAFDPAGKPFATTAAGRFFRNLTGICFSEEISDLVAWLRDPFVAQWMKSEGEQTSRDSWIRECDQWLERIIPSSIDDFLNLVVEKELHSRILYKTLALRRKAQELSDFFVLLEQPILRPILATVETTEGVSEMAASLASIRESAAGLIVDSDSSALARWAIEEAMNFPVYSERPENAIEVLGWLELLWDESPWLQIPDFYDGAIPGVIGTHPLLTESVRQALSIPGRRDRDARDAYILTALLELRKEAGRVDLYVPGRNLENSSVSPSRLLYFTAESDLPDRVLLLSQEISPPLPKAPAPPLYLDAGSRQTVDKWFETLSRISVTSFAAWIRCPFTFYLERVSRLQVVDTDQIEMDPRAFGTGLHEVMRRVDEPTRALDWTQLETILNAAETFLDEWMANSFGSKPGLLLQLQREGLWRRIKSAIKIRYQSRQEGWTPLHVEWNFHEEELLKVGGIPVSGQIDLVEQRGDELRVIDYKTKDKVLSPVDAHTESVGRARSFKPSMLLPVEGDSQRGWIDLQLPLYAAALLLKYPGRSLRIAYILLPRATSDSMLVEWNGFTPSMASDAVDTAERIVDLWRSCGFWPPSKKFPQSDAFNWSGPEGEASWRQGELHDLSESGDDESDSEEAL